MGTSGGTVLDAQVRDLAANEPPLVGPDDRVREIARLIAQSGTQSAVVVQHGQPLGIVTEHDLVTRVLAKGLRIDRARARDVMSSPVRTIQGSARASEAARIMSIHHVRHLPILDDGVVSGMITDRDLLALSPLLFEAARDSDGPLGSLSGLGDLQARPRDIETAVCEGCETLSASVRPIDGARLCEDCADELAVEDIEA